jgi:hypothetical protein
MQTKQLRKYIFASLTLLSLAAGSTRAALLEWVGAGDGAWEVAANWKTDDAVPVNRVPEVGDTIRPRAEGVTITYSETTGSNVFADSTVWQDSSATSSFLQTGGDLEVNQIYLAKPKSNDTAVNYTMTGGSLFVNRNLNMTWSNSNSIDSRFQQTGGSVRIGNGANEGLRMGIKSSNQHAFYDLEGGEFEASQVHLGEGGANATTIFTQGPETTAVINRFLELGEKAGADGQAIYHLNGGELTIQADTDPFIFFQPGAPVYFNFNGGALNLKSTWDFSRLTGIENSDFRVAGVKDTAGDLQFTPIEIEGEAYTQITAIDASFANSLRVTEISHSGSLVTLTWVSKPSSTYVVRLSLDLTNWDADLDDRITGDAGETTTKTFDLELEGPVGIADASEVFFRVEEG